MGMEFPMGMGIPWESHGNGNKHGIGDGNGREWETTSMGMGITCTAMGIYSHIFFLLRLTYLVISIVTCSCHSPDANAMCAEFADYRIPCA